MSPFQVELIRHHLDEKGIFSCQCGFKKGIYKKCRNYRGGLKKRI